MFLSRSIKVLYTAVCVLSISLSVQSCSSDEVDGKLRELASEMNKSLPVTTDSIMRLEKVSVRKGHVLEYNYTILKDDGAIDQPALEQRLKETLIENARSNPAMQAFREDGVIIENHYKSEDGKELFDIRINTGDYK